MTDIVCPVPATQFRRGSLVDRERALSPEALELVRAEAVDALLAAYFPRGDRDHWFEARRVADVVLGAAAPLIAAAAGRMEPGQYAAHWETCWRMHADCAVLHATRLQREAAVDEELLHTAVDVASARGGQLAVLDELLASVVEYSERLPRWLEDRLRRVRPAGRRQRPVGAARS